MPRPGFLLGGEAGGDLSTLPPTDDLLKIFECPVCNEVLLPPIYQCVTGHPICNSCRPKLKQCVLCLANYTDSRNYPLEAIAATSKFCCTYRNEGCPVTVFGSELQKHSLQCPFRPLQCPYGQVDGCKSSVVEMKKFSEHLRTVHRFQEAVVPNRNNSFTFNFTYDNWKQSVDYSSWKGRLIKFDNRMFLSRSVSFGSMFYFTILLIGDPDVASKYLFKFTIRKNANYAKYPESTESSNGVRPQYQMILPVGSVRDLKTGSQSQTDILEGNIQYVALTKSVLNSFGYLIPLLAQTNTTSRTTRFEWQNEYQIIKSS